MSDEKTEVTEAVEKNGELRFDSISLNEVPVWLGGQEYVLREADAEAGAFYDDAMLGSVIMQDGKPISVSNVRQRDLGLLARCLFVRGATPQSSRPVGLSFVNRLPRRITEALVDQCKEMSGIQDEVKDTDEDELGNSTESTSHSSA